ncbi:MAG: hypothetical protein IPK87_03865 [Planctomycetes bacterium]|nr:hypothetical protein [Planctomycetota bacterium]
MRRTLLTISLAAIALTCLGGLRPSLGETSKSPLVAPVDNWGGWWPETQFKEGDQVNADMLANLPRAFLHVRYGTISTECGDASVAFEHSSKGDGLIMQLGWAGPGTSASKEEWRDRPQPRAGDVKAVIVHEGEVVREPTNGEPAVLGWFGGSLSTTGGMTIEFQWLPADYEDYWCRVDVKAQRFWFLIPYGLGSSTKMPLNTTQVERGPPKPPAGAHDTDTVKSWASVKYHLFREKENENLHASLTISNREYPQLVLELYREKTRWTLDAPRTSAAYLWPKGYTRFALLFKLERDFSMRRTDYLQFFHHGHDVACWGVLRVTVEDKATDLCIPSSLLHARHGSVWP